MTTHPHISTTFGAGMGTEQGIKFAWPYIIALYHKLRILYRQSYGHLS